MYMGGFTARVHGCSRRVRTRHTAVHDPNMAMYTAVYARERTGYTVVHRVHGRVYVYGP